MIVQHVRCLRGPNRWAAAPVLEVEFDFGASETWPAERVERTLAGVSAGLLAGSQGLCDEKENGHLRLVAAFAAMTKRLQELAGTPVSFTAVRAVPQTSLIESAIEFDDESVGLAAMEVSFRLLAAAQESPAIPTDEELARLKKLEYDRRLPASTAVVYHAARARGIPATRLNPEYGRYIRLGQGSKAHRCRASEPDTVSAVARMASTDKQLAKQLLQEAGVPVPAGKVVESVEQAVAAAQALGFPLVVKPADADLGTGVSLDLRTLEQVEAAYREAAQHSDEVLVERFAPGLEHRVVVAGDKVVAVTRVDPPHVVGDGVSTVAQLAKRVNQDPRRGETGSNGPLYKLRLDDVAREVLATQDCTFDTVLPAGRRVLVRRNPPYFKNGGNLADLTDVIHPLNVAHSIAAAQAVQLPVAGLDVVALDITQPLEAQGGVVVEVNTSPGLWLHLAPWADSPRPVGRDIVNSLFAPGEDGRVPVVGLVGDDDGTVARHLIALLASAGKRAGSVDERGEVVFDGRRWTPPAKPPQQRANILFQTPTLDVALLKTSAEELLQAGFGNDRCDVAVVLGVGTGENSQATVDCLAALRNALAQKGTFVLGDRRLDGVVQDLPAAQIVFAELSHDLLGEHAPLETSERNRRGLIAALSTARALGLGVETLRTYVASLS